MRVFRGFLSGLLLSAGLVSSFFMAGCISKEASNLDLRKLVVQVQSPSKRMDPAKPGRLGVTRLDSQQMHSIHETPNIRYQWSVLAAFGYKGFEKMSEACADLGFEDPAEFDPKMSVKTPRHWVNGSLAVLQLRIEHKGQFNSTGRFVVDFHTKGGDADDDNPPAGFENAQIVLYPDHNYMDPFWLGPLGVEGFYTIGMPDVTHQTPGVTYKWRPVGAYGYTLYSSQEAALSNIGLVDDSVLNPVVRLTHPGAWPDGSFVLWRVESGLKGKVNGNAHFLLLWDVSASVPADGPAFQNSQVVLYPTSNYMDPMALTNLGAEGFYIEGMPGITHLTPGIRQRWSLKKVYGHLGFWSDQEAFQDVGLADLTQLNPVVTLKNPIRWPDKSWALWELEVEWQGLKNNTAQFLLNFVPGGLGEPAWGKVQLYPQRADMSPHALRDLGVLGFRTIPSGPTHMSPGVTMRWRPVQAWAVGDMMTREQALEDIGLVDDTVLNPFVTLRHPEWWPSGSIVVWDFTVTHEGHTYDPCKFYLYFNDDYTGDGDRPIDPDILIQFYPDHSFMWPYETTRLGVVNFRAVGSNINAMTPGVSYFWEPLSASGFLHPSMAAALSDTTFDDPTVLNPFLRLGRPDLWPPDSKIVFRGNVIFRGITYGTGRFTVTFTDRAADGEWSQDFQIILYPDHGRMDPYSLREVGVQGWYAPGTAYTHNTPGVTYEWIPMQAHGFEGYSTEAQAMAATGFEDRHVLNPVPTLEHPEAWPNFSDIYYKVAITLNGVRNETARFFLLWEGCEGPRFTPDAELDFYPHHVNLHPGSPSSLGLVSFVVEGCGVSARTPGVTYRWRAADASGHLHEDLASALADVTVENPSAFDPGIRVATPALWPAGSSLTLHCDVTYQGVANTSGSVVVGFLGEPRAPGWSPDSQVVLRHSHGRQSPVGLRAIAAGGWDAPGTPVSMLTPNVAYEWSVTGARGWVGFDSLEDAIADVIFVNPNVLHAVPVVLHPEKWPNFSDLEFTLTVTANGISNDTARFFLLLDDRSCETFHGDLQVVFNSDWGAVDSNGVPVGGGTVDPNLRGSIAVGTVDPYFGGPVGVESFHTIGSSVTSLDECVTHLWSVMDASGYVGFGSLAAAIADITIVNPTVLNPTVRIGTPANWPNGSGFLLMDAVSGCGGGTVNGTGRFLVTLDHPAPGSGGGGADGWTPWVKVMLIPDNARMNPFAPRDLGVTKFKAMGSGVDESSPVAYHWQVIDRGGFQVPTSMYNQLNADVTLADPTAFSPEVRVAHPEWWPQNSWVLFSAGIRYNNVWNSESRFLLVFDPRVRDASSESSLPRLSLSPVTATMDPADLRDLGVQAFDLVGGGIDPGAPSSYLWEPLALMGAPPSPLAGPVPLHDVSAVDPAVKNPTPALGHPDAWPDGSTVIWRASIWKDGWQDDTGRFALTFAPGLGSGQGDGDGDDDSGSGDVDDGETAWEDRELSLLPDAAITLMDSTTVRNLRIEGWADRGTTGLNHTLPGVTYRWEVEAAVGGLTAPDGTTVGPSDIRITLGLTDPQTGQRFPDFSPSVSTGDGVRPTRMWPNGSMAILRCYAMYQGKENNSILAAVVFQEGAPGDDLGGSGIPGGLEEPGSWSPCWSKDTPIIVWKKALSDGKDGTPRIALTDSALVVDPDGMPIYDVAPNPNGATKEEKEGKPRQRKVFLRESGHIQTITLPAEDPGIEGIEALGCFFRDYRYDDKKRSWEVDPAWAAANLVQYDENSLPIANTGKAGVPYFLCGSDGTVDGGSTVHTPVGATLKWSLKKVQIFGGDYKGTYTPSSSPKASDYIELMDPHIWNSPKVRCRDWKQFMPDGGSVTLGLTITYGWEWDEDEQRYTGSPIVNEMGEWVIGLVPPGIDVVPDLPHNYTKSDLDGLKVKGSEAEGWKWLVGETTHQFIDRPLTLSRCRDPLAVTVLGRTFPIKIVPRHIVHSSGTGWAQPDEFIVPPAYYDWEIPVDTWVYDDSATPHPIIANTNNPWVTIEWEYRRDTQFIPSDLVPGTHVVFTRHHMEGGLPGPTTIGPSNSCSETLYPYCYYQEFVDDSFHLWGIGRILLIQNPAAGTYHWDCGPESHENPIHDALMKQTITDVVPCQDLVMPFVWLDPPSTWKEGSRGIIHISIVYDGVKYTAPLFFEVQGTLEPPAFDAAPVFFDIDRWFFDVQDAELPTPRIGITRENNPRDLMYWVIPSYSFNRNTPPSTVSLKWTLKEVKKWRTQAEINELNANRANPMHKDYDPDWVPVGPAFSSEATAKQDIFLGDITSPNPVFQVKSPHKWKGVERNYGVPDDPNMPDDQKEIPGFPWKERPRKGNLNLPYLERPFWIPDRPEITWEWLDPEDPMYGGGDDGDTSGLGPGMRVLEWFEMYGVPDNPVYTKSTSDDPNEDMIGQPIPMKVTGGCAVLVPELTYGGVTNRTVEHEVAFYHGVQPSEYPGDLAPTAYMRVGSPTSR